MTPSHASVRDVLAAHGPLDSREVAEFFRGFRHQDVAAVLSTLRGLATKQVYIHSWVRDGRARTYLRARYALGDLPDAAKPAALDNAERCRRYKNRLLTTI